MILECCICRNWGNAKGEYQTPKPEERRQIYAKSIQISHGFCNDCYIIWEEKELGGAR